MLTRPAPVEGIVVEDLDDDVCLYRPATDEVLVLNHTAGDVWRLCDGEATVPQIVDALAAAYRLPPQQLAGDVEAVLVDLHERGYLVESVPV